jgi:hypothetical protein
MRRAATTPRRRANVEILLIQVRERRLLKLRKISQVAFERFSV